MSTAEEVRRVLADKGQATIAEIADELGISMGDQRWHSIGQALSTGVTRGWSERVGRAEYVWLDGGKAPNSKPATQAGLEPLIDNLSDEAFDLVGLTYVARTQDGAFICTDQHGVAWRVEVTATARLI